MAMNLSALTIDVRITIGGESVAFWRVKVLAWCARRLGVPVGIAGRKPLAPSHTSRGEAHHG